MVAISLGNMESKTKEVLESCEKLHEKVLELVHNNPGHAGQKKLRECTTCRCAINRIFKVLVVSCSFHGLVKKRA